MKLYQAFSLFLLTSCATIVRPDANLCIVNAPAEHLKCYNLKHDYNKDGTIKKSAKAKFFTAQKVEDLNKGVWMSNNDWAKVKGWIRELRKAYEQKETINGKH
jgi:hypothetical protein